jgi:hypothetical protein
MVRSWKALTNYSMLDNLVYILGPDGQVDDRSRLEKVSESIEYAGILTFLPHRDTVGVIGWSASFKFLMSKLASSRVLLLHLAGDATDSDVAYLTGSYYQLIVSEPLERRNIICILDDTAPPRNTIQNSTSPLVGGLLLSSKVAVSSSLDETTTIVRNLLDA